MYRFGREREMASDTAIAVSVFVAFDTAVVIAVSPIVSATA